MEASGMVSAGKWFSNTLRHFLWALLGGTALLGGMSIYRIRNDLTEKKVINYSSKVREEFSQIFKTLGLVVGGSFLFFNNGLLRRYTYPLLNRVAQSKTNIGLLAPLVESNIWKGIITMGGCYYYLMGSNNQFKNKWENVVLSGGIGMLLGSVFSGLLLSRYRLKFRSVGGLGIVGGFVGYNSIKGYSEDATNQMLSDANRVFFSPAVLTIPMMISYALTMMYLSGIFFPYGMAFAQGNFTGGFFGGILYRKYLEPNEKSLDKFVEDLCSEYFPFILEKES